MLDLHDLLTSISAPHDASAFGGRFVKFVNSDGNTQVMIDADGNAGSGSAVLLVTLTNAALTQADTANYIV